MAVYTLTESAGKQFKAILEARAPRVRVSLCNDLVASNRLKQLARQADVFLIATWSAMRFRYSCNSSLGMSRQAIPGGANATRGTCTSSRMM